MKKTIRIIDLIVKIANKGEVPKKINYDGLTYIFDIAENNYISEKADYYDGDYITHKYLTESFEFDILNDEVEILDEEEFEDIRCLENEKEFYAYTEYKSYKNDIDKIIYILKAINITEEKIDKLNNQINQLIKNQKKIIEKLNKNNNTQ